MPPDLVELQNTVQHNCNITDAAHAENYTLCIYLLKMREYFRWEQGYGLGGKLPADVLANWVAERESLWETLEASEFTPLNINAQWFDPFDNQAINAALQSKQLIYSAGLGMQCKPNFFLGELYQQDSIDGMHILVAGREIARGLVAPPAVAQGETIVIRREALQHYLWSKVEEWRWKEYDNPVGKALAEYPFEENTDLALERMTAAELETVRAHEIGEVRAGRLLGEEWNDLLLALPRSRAEFMVRAARDHLADALETLPNLLASGDAARMHFYFGSLSAMRKEMAPQLMQAYTDWAASGRLDRLESLIPEAETHWRSCCNDILSCYREAAELVQLPERLVSLLENRLL
jgi:hypothetical protein